MIRMRHDLIAELSRRSPLIASLNLTTALNDVALENGLFNVANVDADLNRVVRAIDALETRAGLTNAETDAAVRNLLSQNTFYGQYLELGAYEWFDRAGVQFRAQERLSGQEVLNPNGVVIDGRFAAVDCYFDIKAMGFQEYVTEQFRKRLEERLRGLVVTIEGSMDVDVRDIQTFAFRQLAALTTVLANGGHHKIPQLDWTVRAEKRRPVMVGIKTSNPYALAEENRYYPFKTAGQFTRHSPFMLVFSYAAQFNHPLFTNFAASSEITLRALARRAFMQFTDDATPAAHYDAQVATGVRLAEASRLLSAMLFINIDTGIAELFLNPRAVNRLTDYHIKQIFDFTVPSDLRIEDFLHDDY